MNKPKIYFITGVCGAGKTTLIPYLEKILEGKNFVIHDFDERGVPDGADHNWRIEETKHWIRLAEENLRQNASTFICGFANPEEFPDNNNLNYILLNASPETIMNRLKNRYKTDKSRQELRRVSGDGLAQFIADNVSFLDEFQDICKGDSRCQIIDTDDLSPAGVAKKIYNLIK